MSIHFHTMGCADEMPPSSPLQLTSATQTIATSATLAINEAVAKRNAAGMQTLHMGFGEAAFPLHPLLKTALAEAATHTYYAPVLGIPALRQAIAAFLTEKRGVKYTAEQIVVGPGSKALLYGLLHILEGDILLPTPSWVSYTPMAHLIGRRVINVPTEPEDHHRLTPQTLSQAVEQARREGTNPCILLINTPSNPTGGMLEQADIEAIALWARENRITLISDEIYAELAHGWREHISPARFYPEGCIVTGGLSKAFSAGGWRLGYAALPPTGGGNKAITALRALGSEIWSAAATPQQEAAVVAFTPDSNIDRYLHQSALLHGYATHRLYETLTQLGASCPRPAGGFYLYPDFSHWQPILQKKGIQTSQALSHYLLEEWGIATLPGSAFNAPPSALRLRLATSLLCEPEDTLSAEEREAALWQILEQAEELSTREKRGTSTLPALQYAQTRWTEVLQAFQALS